MNTQQFAFAACLLVLSSGCGGAPAGQPGDYYRNSDAHPDYRDHVSSEVFQAELDDAVARSLPGVSVLVKDADGLWAGSSGFADLDSGEVLRPEYLTRIGSISKSFVAVTLLRLARQGLVDLDEKITAYLPEDVLRDLANADLVTVRQLLNHTSGIPNYTESLDYLFVSLQSQDNSYDDLGSLAFARGMAAVGAPGEKFYYSNTNFVLAGMIIDAVSPADTDDTIRAEVMEVLGLESTFFDPEDPVPAGLVQGYHDWYGDGVYRRTTDSEVGMLTPDGGFVSNIYDLYDYLTAISLDRGFLTQEELDELLTPGVDDSRIEGVPEYIEEMEYGLGFFRVRIDGVWWQGHAGSNYGYRSMMLYAPEHDCAFIYLSNGNFGRAMPVLDELTHRVLRLMNVPR